MASGLVWSCSRGWVGAGTSLLCGACFGRSLERNRLSKMRQLLQIHVIRENYCMYVKLRFAAALPIIDVRVQVRVWVRDPTGSCIQCIARLLVVVDNRVLDSGCARK